ncbi:MULTISPECIES: EspA/EspE family type VII secretion system effector [unclassified Mycobacterium]|uniref:EspA/EspE family type VII secretion system effector n=1 Tax=unclassified Mycobacterium TaxID=2642494 RepID=UPI0006DD21C4|nr:MULTISPECIES: EspA/EspE family type VII secretion system effector [unclassified Mycobacterium]OBG68460.1 hypothetical protein A5702_14220 [Mycobacterium sp. E3339]OBH83159.1 hypothetical protein A5680_12675 [Mycobacterium sp. E2989]
MANLAEGVKLLTVLGTAGKDLSDIDWNGLGDKISSVDFRAGAGVFSDVGRLARQLVEKFGSEKVKKLMTEGVVPGTPIIDYTIYAITALELLAGFGTPDRGDTFAIGEGKFELIHERLASAFPDERWRGTGSEAYAAQNADHRSRAATMADLDAMMADILKTEAHQVVNLRRNMKTTRDGLTACIAIALALKAVQPADVGEGLSIMFQLVVSMAAIAAVVAFIGEMVDAARDNADRVGEAVEGYRAVQAGAVLPDGPFNSAVVTQAAQAGRFRAGTGAESGVSLNVVTPGATTGSVEAPPRVRGRIDEEEMSNHGDATPATAMPSVAQLMAISGGAQKSPGPASGQRVASVGGQAKQAAPPGEGTARAEAAEASAGAQAIATAPVERIAAAAERAQNRRG